MSTVIDGTSGVILNGTTSGSVTLSAPAIAGTTTITFPATSGTVLQSGTLVTESQGGTGTTTGYYGFKNRIINGAMVIDQRNAGASVTPANSYTLDRWYAAVSQTGKFTVQQNAGSVTPPAGFTNYLGVTSSSAYSVLAGDYFSIAQYIEGYNIADLGFGTANAKTITLSFWVRSSLTGTFGGSLQGAASATLRSYPFSYTISSANTWTQVSVTIAGDTFTNTWNTTNGIGFFVNIGLGAGSSASGTAGTWASANYANATGNTSVVGTNGATFYITGVQLEVGSTATSFDYRPYGTELQLCQRYYFKTPTGTAYSHLPCCGYMDTTTNAIYTVVYPVFMRTAPSLSTSGSFSIICAGAFSVSSFGYQGATTETMRIDAASTGLTAGRGCLLRNNNDTAAYFEFSAEL